jgi:hypothetical protein
MAPTLSPDLVDDKEFQTIARLVDCLRSELRAANGPELCYIGLQIGDRPAFLGLADCKGDKPCGVAWVRLVGIYPSASFPLPDDGSIAANCASPMAYEVEIGVGRCAPRPEGRSMYPDEGAVFNALRLYMSDSRAMKRALMCCLPVEVKKRDQRDIRVMIGNWTPLEQGAGMSGGTWNGWIGPA